MTTPLSGLSTDVPSTTNKDGGTQSDIPFRCDLFDGPAMLRLAAILKQGANKYGVDNWRKIGCSDHINHAIAHLLGHIAGDSQDDHLGHAFCRLMFACATQQSVPGRHGGWTGTDTGDYVDWKFNCLGHSYTSVELTELISELATSYGSHQVKSGCRIQSSSLLPNQHRIYVAGPYRANSPSGVLANIGRADRHGVTCRRKGHYVMVPHSATRGWEYHFPVDNILELDMDFIRHWATAILYFEASEGADAELAEAERLGLTIYRDVSEVPNVT